MHRLAGSAIVAAGVVLVILGPPHTHAAPQCRGKHWVGAWATSPSGSVGGVFVDRSLRLVVNPTLGGTRVRVRLSNRFGTQPVTLGGVTIAQRVSGADLVAGSGRALRFKRKKAVTIPPGGEVVSDQRRFKYDAFQDLVVSLHVSGNSGRTTAHATAIQTSYATPPGTGDHTSDETGSAFTQTLGNWPILTDVEVKALRRVGAIVALGDSITDGFGSPIAGNLRYPDLLAHRLATETDLRLAVQNEGISGNEVLRTGALPMFGPSLLARLDVDALDQSGARAVILMEGTNDIGVPPTPTAAAVTVGLQTVIDRLREAGLRVIVGTLPPCKGFALAQHGTPEAIAKRNEINDWIRNTAVADGVVDFHAVLRDPNDPDQLLAAYDSGDHLHPSAAGYAAMANAIDLSLLDDLPCQ